MPESAAWTPSNDSTARTFALRLFDLVLALELRYEDGRLRLAVRAGRGSPSAAR